MKMFLQLELELSKKRRTEQTKQRRVKFHYRKDITQCYNNVFVLLFPRHIKVKKNTFIKTLLMKCEH